MAILKRMLGLSPAQRRRSGRHSVLYLYGVCGLGGVETSILNKAEALRAIGVEVRALFRSHWGRGGKTIARQPGFVVEADEKARIHFIEKCAPNAIIVVDMPQALKTLDSVAISCPVLFETHISDTRFLERRVLPGAKHPQVSAVVVPSAFNRTVLVENGVEPDRVHIIPNPINLARFRPVLRTAILRRLGVPSDRPVLLFVGRIEPHKNPGEFVRVVAELARRGEDLHCVILGDAVDTGEFAASVQEEASQLAGRVTFVKRLAYEQMPDLYGAVAVSGGCLVSTSLHESQPMIVLEAMACGCPVVASDVGGLREILVDGQTGHLYPLGNVPCAADAVSRLMREKGHREAIVCAALDYVRRTHAPALVARTFVRLLDDIAALAATSDKAKQS